MDDKTLYFVQPFVMRKRKLAAAGALTFVDQAEAVQAGAALARRRAGIVVLAQSYDAARQTLSRPRVLKIHGHVPSEWDADRRAA